MRSSQREIRHGRQWQSWLMYSTSLDAYIYGLWSFCLHALHVRVAHVPRAQFSLVQTDRMCCKYMYRSHSARHAGSRTSIFFLCTSYEHRSDPPSPLTYSVRLKKTSEIYGRPLTCLRGRQFLARWPDGVAFASFGRLLNSPVEVFSCLYRVTGRQGLTVSIWWLQVWKFPTRLGQRVTA